MRYGLALLEKQGETGLTLNDIKLLYGLVSDTFHNGSDEVYPIEISGTVESSAMGFITREAADSIDFDYENSGLNEFIGSILDDMELENEDNHYNFNGIDIYLSR